MDLKIYSSNRMKEATLAVFENLSKTRKANGLNSILNGEKHIVIAPENLSLSVEKAVLDYLKLDGAFDIEVVTINRLAGKLLGTKAKKCLSSLGAVMLMRKVINLNSENLLYYKRSAKSEGFSKEIYNALLELRNNKVSVEELYEKATKNSSPLGAKYKDLALIYKNYESELKKDYNDYISRLELFTEKMPEIKELYNAHLYIVDFYSFTKLEYAVLEGLLKCVKSFSIASVVGGGVRARATDTAFKIRVIAESMNQPYIEQFIKGKPEKPFDVLHREIFSYKKLNETTENNNKVTLFSELNVYDEIKSVAREIKKSVNLGTRYKEIAVITEDPKFFPVIADIFNRFEIPFFLDKKESPLTFSAVRYLVSALNVISSSFKEEEVLTYIKNQFFDCPYEEKELFENYVLKFNIDKSVFKKEFTLTSEENETLNAEKIRKKLIDSLAPFNKNFETGGDFISAIEEFIEKERFNDKIKYNIALKRKMNIENALKAEEQLFKIISDTVREMRELLSTQIQTFDEMKNILISAFDYYDISLIPLYVDSVYVGDYKKSTFEDKKTIFITGAVSGTYPCGQSEKPIISEYDLSVLKAAGIFLEPNALNRSYVEQQQLIDALSEPERLYISYPELSLNGEAYAPSELISSVNSLLFKEKKINKLSEKYKISRGTHLNEQALTFIDYSVNLNNAFYEYLTLSDEINPALKASIGEMLYNNGYKDKIDKAFKEKTAVVSVGGAENYFKKLGEKKYSVSASQIESYTNCPRQHFLKYGLRLKPRRERELENYDIGNLFHAVLELYFKKIKNQIDEISLKEAAEVAKKSIEEIFNKEEFLPLNSGISNKNTLSLVGEECMRVLEKLTIYAKNSNFKPYALEMKFGFTENTFKLKSKENEFYLSGKIDRIDRYKNQVIVLDYKTGKVSENLEEVYFGLKLQLYLYFSAMLKITGFIPVGVFYVPIRDKFIKNEEDDEKRYAYKGQMLNDIEVFFNIDKQAKDTNRGISLGFSLKNDKFDKEKKNAVSEKEMNSILKYTEKLSEKVIEEITDGVIIASPAFECEYCDFKNLCGGGEKRETKLKDAIKAIEKAAEE